tara:strand:- start:1362 stop:1544 length:183 start_codon:yes stop_codon:yes gene_type:complete
MTRRACMFRQADIARALRAMRAAGVKGRVVITPTGQIEIVPTDDRDDRKAKVAERREIVL